MDDRIAENGELAAPDIIVAELLNARWKTVRSGNKAPDVKAVMNFLTRVRIAPSIAYAQLAANLAERLDRLVYDCLYVLWRAKKAPRS